MAPNDKKTNKKQGNKKEKKPRTQTLESMLFPKLRVYFADFPCPHCYTTRGHTDGIKYHGDYDFEGTLGADSKVTCKPCQKADLKDRGPASSSRLGSTDVSMMSPRGFRAFFW
ncbi:hypothetical protein PG993_011295 [Apiospora rasikravindrae]|uniref:Uncharacterized protein n=1 Tax=Apiospora rasikravindrae TaxID=990691 RepID=A0ABR1SDS9_9PEZI